ncbi:hypothetical protein NMY22_g1475 [Coprinellus aureogranulatus]|nr:hypothetical protein NMY22_g1475 [Coprinellus aureogranulatus]
MKERRTQVDPPSIQQSGPALQDFCWTSPLSNAKLGGCISTHRLSSSLDLETYQLAGVQVSAPGTTNAGAYSASRSSTTPPFSPPSLLSTRHGARDGLNRQMRVCMVIYPRWMGEGYSNLSDHGRAPKQYLLVVHRFGYGGNGVPRVQPQFHALVFCNEAGLGRFLHLRPPSAWFLLAEPIPELDAHKT